MKRWGYIIITLFFVFSQLTYLAYSLSKDKLVGMFYIMPGWALEGIISLFWSGIYNTGEFTTWILNTVFWMVAGFFYVHYKYGLGVINESDKDKQNKDLKVMASSQLQRMISLILIFPTILVFGTILFYLGISNLYLILFLSIGIGLIVSWLLKRFLFNRFLNKFNYNK